MAGEYGVFAMLPFLVLYALPTILIFSFLIALYKNTGLIDRLSHALHPLPVTVAKEMKPSFAFRMAARQAAFAVGFSLLIAWLGRLIPA